MGRVLSGWVATNAGWRYTFYLIALALAGCFVAVMRMKADSRLSMSSVRLSAVMPILRNGDIARLYAVAFTIFFAFMALLTFLPFRLKEIDPSYTAFMISMMYSGFLMGIVMSVGATRIIGLCGGERRAMTIGLALFGFSMLLINVPSGADLRHHVRHVRGDVLRACRRHGDDEQARPKPGRCQRPLHLHLLHGGGAGLLLPGLIYQSAGWAAFTLTLTAAIAGAVVITRACVFRAEIGLRAFIDFSDKLFAY